MFENPFQFNKKIDSAIERRGNESVEEKCESIEKFSAKEEEIVEQAENALRKAEPGKLKKIAASLLAAFSIFMGSSSAFAKGTDRGEIEKELAAKLVASESGKIENDSFWEKFVDKIEIAVGAEAVKTRKFQPFQPEAIAPIKNEFKLSDRTETLDSDTWVVMVKEKNWEDYRSYGQVTEDHVPEKWRSGEKTKDSPEESGNYSVYYEKMLANTIITIPDSGKIADFSNDYDRLRGNELFEDLSEQKFLEATEKFKNSIYSAESAQNFFDNLEKDRENLMESQKMWILRAVGTFLRNTYNYDMIGWDKHIDVSDNVMFSGLKSQVFWEPDNDIDTGICGNINKFIFQTANALDVEAWLQSGATDSMEHIWTGVVAGDDNYKQIIFFDYGNIIPTGTLSYRDALGIAERYQRKATIFGSFVANENKVLVEVKSLAAEKMEEAAGFKETGDLLEENLSRGEKIKENVLEIKISPEIKKIKLAKDSIGLTFYNFQDTDGNPYQSIEKMDAFTAEARLQGKNFGIESKASIINANIKDLDGGLARQEDLLLMIAGDYINSKNLSKSELGKFVVNFGATVQAGVDLAMRGKDIKEKFSGAIAEGAVGGRLIYFNPSETGKFYMGLSENYRETLSDFQEQKLKQEKFGEVISVGAEVEVLEGNIVNFDVSEGNFDWGNRSIVKTGIERESTKIEIALQTDKSNYERFVPSVERVSAEAGYKGGPKWEIDVLGFKEKSRYADASSEKKYGAEVKLKMFLW